MGLLLLVRHGQASFGAEDYDVLSADGVAQSRWLGEALAVQGLAPDVVVHGGLRRQRDTATAMIDAAGWRLEPTTDVRWDEFDHLAVMSAHLQLTGQPAIEVDRRAFQEQFERATSRWTSGVHDEEYAESYPAFTDRVGDALREAARAAGPGRTAVVVTSGGPIAAVCALLTQLPSRPTEVAIAWHRLNAVMVNASITRVVVGSTGARLLTFNEHAHLGGKLVTYR